MRYIVYTDGAGDNEQNKAACSYLVYTNNTFISKDYKSINGISNPTHAETIAVGLVAGFLAENLDLKKTDLVEFNVDCVSTIEFCIKYAIENPEESIPSREKLVVISIQLLRKLNELCKVKIYKVRGHKSIINPNSYVDRLAKLGVRQ